MSASKQNYPPPDEPNFGASPDEPMNSHTEEPFDLVAEARFAELGQVLGPWLSRTERYIHDVIAAEGLAAAVRDVDFLVEAVVAGISMAPEVDDALRELVARQITSRVLAA